ncbi:MAG: DUF547 domain-containing protein [Gammaproteobacteria bacterium]
MKKIMRLISVLIFLLANSSLAGAEQNHSIAEIFSPYAQILKEYLVEKKLDNGGLVAAFRYREAMADPGTLELINDQKQRLREFNIEILESREKAISFWLNAYNFFMLAHILENPKNGGELVDSVRDYGIRINPYRVFKQNIFAVGNQKYSLSQIEKDILLGDEYQARGWKEARVHFAVNCASVGCPPLRAEIYTPDNVDVLMTENTRKALKTARHFNLSDDALYLSQLFEWYTDDYVDEAGSVKSFLKQYTDSSIHQRIEQSTDINYIDYDWSLNEPQNFPEFSRISLNLIE